ncbi:alpha-amylase family glycosyl hydrolase [Gaetbulibacter sp. M235]|uniref:alpha-amylase family glycosyl hydrolase n=1 Tax=Gaetbulibacter sp. M235 TaxID=3126510 RepID=UPI00374F7FC6
MKKIAVILFTLVLFIACNDKKGQANLAEQVQAEALAPMNSDVMETAVIYEANIRQYSQQGTFDEFTKDIPQLKQLGVKIIWLMPINPISVTKRKATGGDFASKIEDETERAKMLGSYYAVSDYTKINPEFGTLEDFRELVKTAHDNGIYVILDWVPNHTGWDHNWIKEHPDFYVKNADGEITDPLNDDGTSKGWGDVAQLDYSNMAMQEQMIKDMMYWVEKEQVDGFRCDHIQPVPVSFWEKAIPQLNEKRALFWLAENDEPRFMKANLFDMEYGWKQHHLMNRIAQGSNSLEDFDSLTEYIASDFEKDDILMNFVTNHDENSWAGTVEERLGDASEVMTVFSYMVPGMPLIYSGQEYNLNHRLKFFEKDSIPKTKGTMWPLLEKLGKLKNENIALNGGKKAASSERIKTDNKNILIYTRSKGDQTILFVANLSSDEQELNYMPQGTFLNYMNDEEVNYTDSGIIKLNPWEYKILIMK